MALSDADRRRLAEIERHLEQEHPGLARSLRREPVKMPRLPTAPVLGAVLVLLVSFGWLSVQGGNPVPLLLAAVPAAAALLTLRWQRGQTDPPDSPAASDRPSAGPGTGAGEGV